MNAILPSQPRPHDLQADIDLIGSIEAVPTILDVVCRTTGMGFAAVARVTETRWVACRVRDDIAFGLQPGGELRVESTICHEIREKRTPVVINHVAEDKEYCGHPTPAEYGFQSYISMPILLPDGTFFGTLCAIDPKPAQVDAPEVVGTFRMFADLIAFHIEAHRKAASAQDAIRSEAFVRGILAASPDCVKVLSADGRLEYMNERGVELNQLGSLHDVLGQGFADLWPEGERAKIRHAIERAASGEIARTEGFCPTAKGKPRWWEASFAPFRPEGGKELKIVGVSRDVTERALAERAEAQNQARLSIALKVAKLGTFDWNTATGTVYADERSREIFGLPAEGALRADDVFGRIAPEDVERVQAESAAAVAAGEAVDIAYDIVRPDGSRRAISSSGSRILDVDGEPHMVGVFHDVTDLRRAEGMLREENVSLERQVADRTAELRLYRDIVQSDSSPILAFDTDYRLTGFNQAHADEFLRVMGHHQQVGDVLPDLFPPEQASLLRDLMDRALAGETFSVTEEFGDEERVKPTWDVTYAPLRDAEGRIVGAFHHARDVSGRLRAEAELNVAQEALRQSQKLEAVGQLTGGVAHDFNNLLTIIRSSVDFLRRPNLAEERRTRYMDAVSDTVDRAAKLTGQLLAFARRQALKPEVFDVGAQLGGVADMLDTVTGARIRVVTGLPDQPCFVKADLSQFETALVNMAVNARDAMDGEGTLTLRLVCSATLPTIRGHGGAAGPFAAVSLTDTGSGMASDQLGRIFEPFFTTKEVGKGTGLGLSQVFGFAKQSGGDVDVESTPGEGTTFTLFLPEVEDERRPVAPAKGEGEAFPVGDGQCVLVVEDNIEVGRFATQILEDLGYRTTWATNAEEALEKLGADGSNFDAVFSDVVMPGMGGIALAKLLRQRLPDLPVLLASGYSHVLSQDGSDGFELLHKPYSADQLGRILAKVVPRHAASRS
jgi:PAS domain S-box-containing protein